jgi:hypothetical protein
MLQTLRANKRRHPAGKRVTVPEQAQTAAHAVRVARQLSRESAYMTLAGVTGVAAGLSAAVTAVLAPGLDVPLALGLLAAGLLAIYVCGPMVVHGGREARRYSTVARYYSSISEADYSRLVQEPKENKE